MALRRLDKSFAPTRKEINYLNKTFGDYRQSLIDFAKVYFPDSYNDFNESSPGMMFMEMASYVGDVLGYYIDTNFRENLLQYANEQDNIISMAQAFGYQAKPATAAMVEVDMFQIVPAKDLVGNYAPDERFYMRLAPNLVVATEQFGTVNFRTIDELNFADPTDREITVYSVGNFNQPTFYLIRKKAKVVAGTIKTYSTTFLTPEKFSKLVIPDENVLDIISVTGQNGLIWNQVDYLAQDLVFHSTLNTATNTNENFSVPPTYTLKLIRTARRFVVRYNTNFECELHFGSGVIDDSDPSVNLESKKIANSEYETNLGSTSLDPSDFLSTQTYGLSPTGLITVTYSTGGGVTSNVPMNTITRIVTAQPLNDIQSFTTDGDLQTWYTIRQSLAVNNPEPATGGKGVDSVEEIRQNALAFFNAQNRLVTSEDYIVRTYAMPGKFGGISKVFVVHDEQVNNILKASQDQQPQDGGIFVNDAPGAGVINMYVLGYNNNKKLTTLNSATKQNLKTYLDQYRMLTDTVRIMDAFVINIGVNFRVVVFKGFNMNEVLARCIDAIEHFFNIDKWQISQPIIINDLYMELASIEGVQSVLNVEVFNRYQYKDGSDYNDYLYDINSATSDGVIYPSLDPSIWEIRYPDRDIIGSAIQ